MTPELEKLVNETFDLCTVMRPFLIKKPPSIAMSTLCMLASEVVVNTSAPGTIDSNIELMAKCVAEYVQRLQERRDADQADI